MISCVSIYVHTNHRILTFLGNPFSCPKVPYRCSSFRTSSPISFYPVHICTTYIAVQPSLIPCPTLSQMQPQKACLPLPPTIIGRYYHQHTKISAPSLLLLLVSSYPHVYKLAPPNSTASTSSTLSALLRNLAGNSSRSHTSPGEGCTLPSCCAVRFPIDSPYPCLFFPRGVVLSLLFVWPLLLLLPLDDEDGEDDDDDDDDEGAEEEDEEDEDC